MIVSINMANVHLKHNFNYIGFKLVLLRHEKAWSFESRYHKIIFQYFSRNKEKFE